MIPKIIWQTHEKPFDELEPFQKNIAQTWKGLNPGWKYVYADSKLREKHIKDYSESLYNSYIMCSGINQADIWRIIVTYEYGGFYADMDSICLKPLDEIINENYNNEDIVCSSPGFQTYTGGINNSNLGAIKNSKILKLIINKVQKRCNTILKNADQHYLFQCTGVIIWDLFCNTSIENKEFICFQDSYFSHSKDYKDSFDIN